MSPKQAIKTLFKAWENNDSDAVADLFTTDGVYEDPLMPETLTGNKNIRNGCRESMDLITGCKIEVYNLFENADTGFVEGLFVSRLIEDGSAFTFPFMAIVEMKNGKIARLAEYLDTKPLL